MARSRGEYQMFVGFTLPITIIEQLDKLADEQGQSRSAIIRGLLVESLQKPFGAQTKRKKFQY